MFLGLLQVNPDPQVVKPVRQIRFRARGAGSARVCQASMDKAVPRDAPLILARMAAALRTAIAYAMMVSLAKIAR